MPIYEFLCRGCQERFETLVRAADSERKIACPGCGSKKLHRLFSTFATEWKPSNVNWHRVS